MCPPFLSRFFGLLIFLLTTGTALAGGVTGRWVGHIDLPTQQELEVRLVIVKAADGSLSGTVSIPEQGALDVPLTGVRIEERTLVATIVGVPGEPTFRGVLDDEGLRMEGTFTQGMATMPFSALSSEARSIEIRGSLDSLLEALPGTLEAFEVPGVAIAIVAGDEVILAEGYGLRDVDEMLPVTAETLFAIGSSTKAFTTALLASLVDEGRLEWDEPVRSYLEDFRLMDEHATAHLNVTDLVTHRAGLPRHDLAWYNAAASRRAIYEKLRYLEPNADLREKWQYQNLMYLTAGVLIEELSGASWEHALQARLLDPLGMERSTTSLQAVKEDADHARPYDKREGSLVEIPFRPIEEIGPAGSIFSSVNDMARWVRMHLAGGKLGASEILSPASIQHMHTPVAVMGGYPPTPHVLNATYAPGWMVDVYRGLLRVHHGGNIDGFSALVTLLPFEEAGVVVLSNRNATPIPELLTRSIIDRIAGLEQENWLLKGLNELKAGESLQDQAEENRESVRIEGTQPSRALADYAGRYSHPGYGVLEVSLEEEALFATFNRIVTPLEHWHYDVFRGGEGAEDPAFEGMLYQFRSNSAGEISEIVVPFEPSVDAIVFERMADELLQDPVYLARFVGLYQLGPQQIRVALMGDELTVRVPGQPTLSLVPERGASFVFAGLTGYRVTFLQDDAGEVSTMRLEQPNGVFEAERVAE